MRRTWLLLVFVAALAIAIVSWKRATHPQGRTSQEPRPAVVHEVEAVKEPTSSATVLDDETGDTVAGARITLYRISEELPGAEAIAAVVADQRGVFSLAIPQDNAIVVIEAPGYPPQPCWPEEGEEIRLKRGVPRTYTILEEEGRPAAGAVVDAYADGGMRLKLASAEADSQGIVTLQLTGDETLLVRHVGYAFVAIDPQRNALDTVSLVPEYTIGGQVVDSAGKPIAGASARLRQGSGCITESDYEPTVLAARDGKFLFRGILGCDCELTVRAAGYAVQRVDATPGNERMRIVMYRDVSASGTVVMPDGSPAAGASVSLDWLYGGEQRNVETDAEGRFAFTNLEPRKQEIRADGEGDLSARIEVTPAEGEALTGLRLDLGSPNRFTSFLRLQVVDERGRAVLGARVKAHNGHGSTDRDGVATLDTGARPGLRTTIAIRPPAEEPQRLVGTDVPAITSTPLSEAPLLRVVLHDGVLVRIEARAYDGSPLADAKIELFRDGINSDDDIGNPVGRKPGWFLDPNDTYLIRIRAPGHLLFEERRWSPRHADGLFVATLRPCAAVRFRVTDAQGVTPEQVHATVDFHLDHRGMGQRLTRGPDGSFLLAELQEGSGVLTVGCGRGEAEAAVEVETRSGQTTDVGCLRLAPPTVHAGRIVDATGLPLGGARVYLLTGLPDCYICTFSRANGTYRIPVPASARVPAVVVRKRGYGTVRVPLADGAPSEIPMPAPGAVEITVDTDWLVTEDLTAEVLWHEGGCAGEGYYDQLDQHPYVIDDLAPGRYLVRLTSGDVVLQDEIQVAAGAATKVKFRLR